MYINVRYNPNSQVKYKNSSKIGIKIEKINTSFFLTELILLRRKNQNMCWRILENDNRALKIKVFKIHSKNLLLKPDRNDKEEGRMNRLLKIRTNIILLNS
jgi:hypothetical protein